jgi:hypothetical protein
LSSHPSASTRRFQANSRLAPRHGDGRDVSKVPAHRRSLAIELAASGGALSTVCRARCALCGRRIRGEGHLLKGWADRPAELDAPTYRRSEVRGGVAGRQKDASACQAACGRPLRYPYSLNVSLRSRCLAGEGASSLNGEICAGTAPAVLAPAIHEQVPTFGSEIVRGRTVVLYGARWKKVYSKHLAIDCSVEKLVHACDPS